MLQHGIENEVIHADAWTKLKATKQPACNAEHSRVESVLDFRDQLKTPRHVERLKEEIFEIAVRNRSLLSFCVEQCRATLIHLFSFGFTARISCCSGCSVLNG